MEYEEAKQKIVEGLTEKVKSQNQNFILTI